MNNKKNILKRKSRLFLLRVEALLMMSYAIFWSLWTMFLTASTICMILVKITGSDFYYFESIQTFLLHLFEFPLYVRIIIFIFLPISIMWTMVEFENIFPKAYSYFEKRQQKRCRKA